MLPSQSGRPYNTRQYMYRRRRPRRLPAVIALAAFILGGGFVFKWWTGGAEPAGTNAAVTTDDAQLDGEANFNQASASAMTPTPSSPASRNAGTAPTTPERRMSTTAQTQSQHTSAGLPDRISMGESIDIAPKDISPPPAAPPQNPSAPSRVASSSASSPSSAPTSGTTRSAPSTTNASASNTASNRPASQHIQAGLNLIAQGKLVEARETLSAALRSSNISPADAERIRTELTKVNQRLIFSPEVVSGDSFAATHTIQRGDYLSTLPKKLNLQIDWRLLARINRIHPDRLQIGQRIKTIKGPFHAVVHKQAFRMDVYMGPWEQRLYVCSFPVGLGEYGATPEGAYTVKTNSKLVNPAWTNPRTGQSYTANDPENPIGEHWIGLIGISDNIRGLEGYGIHGTIEPHSIGREMSMGCVRMHSADVELIYELLTENVSRVEIHGEDYP